MKMKSSKAGNVPAESDGTKESNQYKSCVLKEKSTTVKRVIKFYTPSYLRSNS